MGSSNSADAKGGWREKRAADAGYQVAYQQARRSCAERGGREYVLALAERQHFAANDARVAGPAHRGQRDYQIDKARSENRSERDGEQDSRKREHDIDGAHHEIVDSPA